MTSTTTLKTTGLAVAMFVWPLFSRAAEMARCDRVFGEVRAAVEREPDKILVIIEDAMVASETCACEIVKAAILASKANPELTRQIVLTATHIAPKMGTLIAECAGIAPPGEAGVLETVEKGIGIQSDGVQSLGIEGGSGDDDYSLMPGDIRGVYLIQPSTGGAGGFSTSNPATETAGGSTTVVVKRQPPKNSVPQSPSVAQGP